ncbi:MAG: hypothetical protein NVS1B13_03360 [Flavisolibacter sp.]
MVWPINVSLNNVKEFKILFFEKALEEPESKIFVANPVLKKSYETIRIVTRFIFIHVAKNDSTVRHDWAQN